MKLQTRINFFMLFMLALLGIPVVIAGYLIISDIVYDLNEKLLQHELTLISKNLQETQDTLNEAGVAGLERYVKLAQKEALEKIVQQDSGKVVHALIFDKQGQLLLNSHAIQADANTLNEIVQPMLKTKRGKAKFTDDADAHFGVYSYFDAWNWLILVEIREKEIFASRTTYIRFVLLISFGVLLGVLLLSYIFTRGTSFRIQYTLKALKQIECGDMSVRLDAPRKDEIGAIQHGINAMAEKNADLYRTLEQKVEERTVALANANQEITQLNQQLQTENRRMSTELDITRRIQQMVLPKTHELQNIYDLDIAGYMESANEVGGDYYDVLTHQGCVKIAIGDVTGHGLESGMLMLMVQMAVRTLLLTDMRDPARFLQLLNQAVFSNIQRMGTDKNLTLTLLDYDKEQDKFGFIGQHEEILVLRQGGEVERLDTIDMGFPVGILGDISPYLHHQEIDLQPGDGIILYTDGVTEAFNFARKMYSVERLCEVAAKNWQGDALQIQSAIIEDLRQHTAGREVLDDITLLVIKRKHPEKATAEISNA